MNVVAKTELIIVSILLIGVYQSVKAQGSHSQCLNILRSAFQKVSVPPLDTAMYHINITVKTYTEADSVTPHKVEHIDSKIGFRRIDFEYDNLKLYKDSTHTIAIFPKERTIRIVNVGAPLVKDSMITGLLNMQNLYLDRVTIEQCEEKSDDPIKTIYIQYSFDSLITSRTTTYRMCVWIDAVSHQLSKVVAYHKGMGKTTKTETLYNILNYDYRDPSFIQNVLLKIYSSDNQLLPQYIGYKIDDMRSKKTNRNYR